MFFGWGEVVAMYTFKELFFFTVLILAVLSFLLYGMLQIIRDNHQLRKENDALRKQIAKTTEKMEEIAVKKSL